jgi:hypothetical protein
LLVGKAPYAATAAAMSTASNLFFSSTNANLTQRVPKAGVRLDSVCLLSEAAESLALDPGEMCLISLGSGEGRLRPTVIAHAEPGVRKQLQRILGRGLAPDAFSRSVARSLSSLNMPISQPRLMRLWLPPQLWACAETAEVNSVLACALVRARCLVGTLLLWRERKHSAFVEEDLSYVTALGERLALALPPRA